MCRPVEGIGQPWSQRYSTTLGQGALWVLSRDDVLGEVQNGGCLLSLASSMRVTTSPKSSLRPNECA